MMVTNGVYSASVTMQNYGTTTWYPNTGHGLGSQSPQDNGTWGMSRVPLNVGVPPGEIVTFNFQVRAPGTAGTYGYQWRMLQEHVEWFGSYTPQLSITVRDPVNNAQPTAQSVPAQMEAGQAYNVSVTVVNNGETTWTRAQQYTLMAQSPHNTMTWGLNRVPLPFDNVAPGQSATFNFQVTAPSAGGSYAFQWGMQREGHGSFAPPPQVNDAQVVGISVPARMVVGQEYNVSATMRNAGTKTWSAGTLHRLGLYSDANLWNWGRAELAASVAPGQQYTFNFRVRAPVAGTYDLPLRMLQENIEWFGAIGNTRVTVTENLGNVTFIHTDGLGSPVARTAAAGQVIAGSRTRYEPYGYVASGATPTIGFTGHVNDVDTGLTYMQQRYYDPVAGRFLSIDPVVTDLSSASSFNRYVYTANNPYRYIDPDGRAFCGAYQCKVYGEDTSRAAQRSQDTAAARSAGAIIGGVAGGVIAGGCDLVTFATCAAANPVIVGGGIAVGGAVGAAVGPSVMESGRLLTKNIASVFGIQKQNGQHAHHIVAEGDRRAAVSKKILDNVGMDVNSAWNGMILPARYHYGLHTDTYHINVQAALTSATNYPDVAARLTAIRAQIYMGIFPY